MDEGRFIQWLLKHGLNPGSVRTVVSACERVEREYGDLDELWDVDQLAGVLEELKYSRADERAGRPNPSSIEITGNLYTVLAAIRSYLSKYIKFKEESDAGEELSEAGTEASKLLAFERESELQRHLRANLAQLHPGLEIVDDGNEHRVGSGGQIDILARDDQDRLFVIELKAGEASPTALAQILDYMNHIRQEVEERAVLGIIVARDFHPRLVSAVAEVENVSLFSYQVDCRFTFEQHG